MALRASLDGDLPRQELGTYREDGGESRITVQPTEIWSPPTGSSASAGSVGSMTTTADYGPKTALDWSMQAMHDATDRVNKIPASDLAKAFAAIGEAVWWITIVNDSLRKTYETKYKRALELSTPNPADTLLGLKSVRNRIGHEVDLVDFIEPFASRPDPGDGRITAWTWRHVRQPSSAGLKPWQYQSAVKAHKAYETAVVDGSQGGNIVYTFGLVTGFLDLVYQHLADPACPKP
jgi:hypothetical protein